MDVDKINHSKTSYVLPLSGCDATFGMSFLNSRKLTYPEKDIVTLDDMEFFLIKDHDELCYTSAISRRNYRTRPCDREDYARTHDPRITNEFSGIFLEGLPSGMPPERKVMHEISLYPNSPPHFNETFRRSRVELQDHDEDSVSDPNGEVYLKTQSNLNQCQFQWMKRLTRLFVDA